MILNAILLAFRQISRNYLRAFLTMLGIIIGVGSVIVMVTLGNGTTQMIRSQIASLGSNLLVISPVRGLNTGGGSLSRRFTNAEVELLRANLTMAESIAPISQNNPIVQYAGANTQTTAQGVTNEFFKVAGYEIALGREFKSTEVSSNVCILGESVRVALFKSENPLGQTVRVGKSVCNVIGVLESKGQTGGNDRDDVILLPFKTFLRDISGVNSTHNINIIMVSLKEDSDSSYAVQRVKEILRDARNIKPGQIDTFNITDTREIEQKLTDATKTLTLFLGAVAGVSLIVGGIGIMNIMLVSVTERTREIGTRLAIGALESDVMMQFLIESIVVSALGGVIGIILAFFISWFVSVQMQIPFDFDIWVAFGAFVFSALVGVIFGYIPARRASKLDPIDALRYE